MTKPLTRAEWLEWLDTTWKKCLHEAWDKEWTDMKEDDDTLCYRSELEAAVKAEREAIVCDVLRYLSAAALGIFAGHSGWQVVSELSFNV